MRVRLNKIASSTRNADIHERVVLGAEIPARAGAVVAVRVLDDKSTYNKLENTHGRLMTVHKGDLVAGVLGARQALRGYAGEVPDQVKPGDILHLLNLGGVIGRCTSANPDVGPPARVEVLGSILTFPDASRRVGVAATIDVGPVKPSSNLHAMPPLVLVVGSCMHAGKTFAACTVIRSALGAGLRAAATKVTGVALRKDALNMMDHGAVEAWTFNDAGLASTCGVGVVPYALGCLNKAAECEPDLIVVELGDGLLGDYGVMDILNHPGVKAATSAVILSAPDPVAAWGGSKLLEQMGYATTVVTGPATDNDAGRRVIRDRVGCAAHNAMSHPDRFSTEVLVAMGLAPQSKTVAEATA